MSDTTELIKIMCDFMRATISGHESAFYKAITAKMLGIDLSALKNAQLIECLITPAMTNYMNNAYVSLIKNNDAYIKEYFDRMQGICGHSCICLLNIICFTGLGVHMSLDRTNLDTSSYNNYMKTMTDQLEFAIEKTKEALTLSISHVCKGIDIKTCDPNVPLFSTKKIVYPKN